MKPCKNLDYEREYVDCSIETCAPHYPDVRYWLRHKVPYYGAKERVQFCKLMGRVDGIFGCYNRGEMSCYDESE